MTQRRAPSGQGPAARRTTGTSRPTTRVRIRDTTTTRISPARTTTSVRRDRPGTAKRTVAAGTTKRTVATRPKAFTGRAAVLVIVLVVLALAYTYPLRVYLAQESQIAKMEAAHTAQRAVIADKAGEVAKWQDPEYVRIQARDRLFYVLPGEVPLLIINDPAGAARDAGQPPPAAAPDRWYDTLWSSVAKADSESGK
ncbi:MAG TPA: septum formation initiator family protein [Actinoplanes sp.]|nr:septum formation initiator family protein [Actinoplanes sp.]